AQMYAIVHLGARAVSGTRLFGQLVQEEVEQARLIDQAQFGVKRDFGIEVHGDTAAVAPSLSREEINRFGGGDAVDILGIEVEQAHQRHDLGLELRILELAGNDATHGHFACRGNGELEHQLALQFGVVAQRARIETVDAALVAVEDQLDLLARARRLAAAAAGRRSAGVE